MGQIESIYERANLEYIVDSLLDENEKGICIGKSYEQRLKKGKKPLMDELDRIFARTQQYLEMESLLNSTLATFEDVYFEVGLKVGAMLQRDLLAEN